jgi:hypothetical protein
MLVATGDADVLRARVAAIPAAGGDHVAVIPLSTPGRQACLEPVRAITS